MNLFSSEYKSFSSSVAVRVLDDYDDPLPGILSGAVIKNEDLISTVLEYNTTGWFQRVEDYYQYGKDEYIRGLPQILATSENINLSLLKDVIQKEINSDVEFLTYRKDAIDVVHYVNQFLQDVRGMDQVTKQISVLPSGIGLSPPVYYVNFLTGTIPEENHASIIDIVYEGQLVAENTIGTYVERIYFTGKERQAYQVRYKLRNSSGNPYGPIKYWTYYIGSGKPDLDVIPIVDSNVASSYYPVIPFYEDKTQIGDPANEGTPLYDQSKELMSIIGFTYEDVVLQLEEGTEESIGKDKGLYAYFYLGVEVTAGLPKDYFTATSEVLEKAMQDAQPSLHYLIEFFLQEEKAAKYQKDEFDRWNSQFIRNNYPRLNSLVITDDNFNSGISYYYITKSIVNGSIGSIDWCKSTVITDNYSITDNEGLPSQVFTVSTLVLMKQITDTNYLEIKIVGLSQNVEIFNQRSVTTNLLQRFEENEVLIVVPLDRNIVLRLKDEYKNPLIQSSLFFIFNAYQRVEIEWYQTFAWKFIFTAIALYLSIPTGGFSVTNLTSLFTIAGITQAAYAILMSYIKYLITNAIVKVVARELGLDFAFIAALAMIAYGKFGGNSLKGLPWANQMTSLGSSIWNASNEYLKEQAKQLQEEASIMDIEAKRLQDDLDRAKKLLNTDPDMDPWYFVNPTPDLIWGQSPSEYYEMSNGTMNLAGQVLEGPSNYTKIMLKLPDINDTIFK